MRFRDSRIWDSIWRYSLLVQRLKWQFSTFTLVHVTPHMPCHRKICVTSSLNIII